MKSALLFAALATAASTLYEIEYVTRNHTTEVTVTLCLDHACATTVHAAIETTVTSTVNGVETVYTTICPLTELAHAAAPVPHSAAAVSSVSAPLSAPVSKAAQASPSTTPSKAPVSVLPSLAGDSFVDVTVTPTTVVTKPVEATTYAQLTFTLVFNSNLSVAGVSAFEAGARRAGAGAAALAVGAAAWLL